MPAKNQPVTEEQLKAALKNHPTEERLKEIVKNYPDKDYLEERLDLLKQEITIEFEEKLEEKLNEKLGAFEKRFYKALGSTVVDHEQRITKLEEVTHLTR